MTRVSIFVDGSSFYFRLKEYLRHANIDFGKLTEILVADRTLIRCNYYNAPVHRNENPELYKNQQRFLERLYKTPYLDVYLGRLEKRGDVLVEKGVDIRIAVDMVRMAYSNAFDTAILISNDGDFAIAIEAVKEIGKHVECANFKSNFSYHLLKVCDRFIPLDDLIWAACLSSKEASSSNRE